MKNQFYQIISIIAIISYFIPLSIVVFKKLWKEKPFVLFAGYWGLNGIVSLLDKVPGIDKALLEKITVVYNMLDIPIVLGLLFIATSSASIKKFTKIVAPSFLLLQLINFMILGWNYGSAKYTLALGLLLILTCLVWEISLFMHKLEHTDHENAMIFIYVSLLFAYGTFIVIYIFDYYVTVSDSNIDNFLIYYISSLVAIIIASIGFLAKKTSRKIFL